MLRFLLPTLIVGLTSAASNGDVTLCDPTSKLFGCSSFRSGDRTDPARCNDGRNQIMTWTQRMGMTTRYTLRTDDGPDVGNDQTKYIPGTVMTLHFSVRDPDWKYRGLLINAVDNAGTVVGGWEFPGLDIQKFWSPSTRGDVCARSLLHTNADEKPYNVKFFFRTPPYGTGNITLRTLVKRGVANTGTFHILKDLELGELALVAEQRKAGLVPFWTVGEDGENCDDACFKNNGTCDSETMIATESSPEAFAKTASTYHPCPQTLFESCSQVAPAVETVSESCLIRNTGCVVLSNETCANPSEAECSAGAIGFKRFCACSAIQFPTAAPTISPTTKGPTTSPTTSLPTTTPTTSAPTVATTTASATTKARRHKRSSGETSSSASTPSVTSFLSVALAVGSMQLAGGTDRVSTGLMAVTLTTLAMATPVSSHNWMFTTGRARKEASTTAPCRGRTGADTHAQVGPDQTFTIRWATGHERDSYWVIVHGDDYSWLSKKGFKTFVKDYLAKAPDGSDTARVPKFQRYHGMQNRLKTQFLGQAKDLPDIYGEEILPTNPVYLNHSTDKEVYPLFQFTDQVLANDRRVSYKSELYPWIEAVYRYEHVHGRAVDFDSVRVDIPGRKGPGHYVVHWFWNGYYDCVDVNRHEKPIDPSIVDGLDTETYTYEQIDHCQYVDPDYIATPCRDATNGTEQCRKDLTEFGKKYKTVPMGINVVPALTPAKAVLFGGNRSVNIPWKNQTCGASDWMVLKGKVTTNNVGNTYGGTKAAMSCRRQLGTTTGLLASAVKLCSSLKRCAGIAWDASGDTDAEEYTAIKKFYACENWARIPLKGFAGLLKPAMGALPSTFGPETTVSFQPAGIEVPLPPGYVASTGEVRNQTHPNGWRCKMATKTSRTRDGLMMLDEAGEVTYTGPSTVNLTFVNIFTNYRCDDGFINDYEYKVPNGAYEVSLGIKLQVAKDTQSRCLGCQTENVQLTKAGSFFGQKPVRVVNKLQVSDGTISFSGRLYKGDKRIPIESNGFCNTVNDMRFRRIGDSLPSVWFPGSAPTGAWWQTELDSKEPIGVVSIKTSNAGCEQNWLFKGNDCQNPNRAYGPFHNTDNEGAIVTVADEPCTDQRGCVGGFVCQRVMLPKYQMNKMPFSSAVHAMTPFGVECNGTMGKYIRIHLPGKDRIFSAQVTVSRTQPKAMTKDTKVCYGLAAREKKETAPEFILSNDPEDPVFYSTCFERRRKIEFLPLPTAVPLPIPKWTFNGECLDCDLYQKNLQPANTTGIMAAPTWMFADPCVNCTQRKAYLDTIDTAIKRNITSTTSELGMFDISMANISMANFSIDSVDAVTLLQMANMSDGDARELYAILVKDEKAKQAQEVEEANPAMFVCSVETSSTTTNSSDTNSSDTDTDTNMSGGGSSVVVTASVSMISLIAITVGVAVFLRRRHKQQKVGYGKHRNRNKTTTNPVYDNPLRFAVELGDGSEASDMKSKPSKPMRSPPPVVAQSTAKRLPPPLPPPPMTSKPSTKPSVPASKPIIASKPKLKFKPTVVSKPSPSQGPPPRPPAPTLAPAEEPQWEPVVDVSNGDIYFVDQHENTTWDSPFGDWSCNVDNDTGDVYYVHNITGETSWDQPEITSSSTA